MIETKPKLGVAILERPLLRVLETLWEGPVAPDNLDAIELAIRAFLVSPVLIASRVQDSQWGTAWEDVVEDPSKESIENDEAFRDSLLDYEFSDPKVAHPYTTISSDESDFLKSLVLKEIEPQALEALPRWIKRNGEAYAYLDAWYDGYAEKECENRARLMYGYRDELLYEDELEKLDRDHLYAHPLFHLGPANHANYLVGCHRAGLTVYGISPITKICATHIFSKWPDYLFKTLGEEYKRASEELRGPGMGVTLPPLTALLLSRARTRDDIPVTLRDLREEYTEARDELWSMLSEMWFAPTCEDQLKILRQLSNAASSLFVAAFPERFDALGLAISATDLLTLTVSSTLSTIREHFNPGARVGAISFASKLAKDLRLHLLGSHHILKRHFTEDELKEFGTGRLCWAFFFVLSGLPNNAIQPRE
ncbi:MAG: hypothetical protein JW765_08585 [Deltaproteobacteria bacterium]|nr:hypothetical protein [Candidatus Zymogenaceae bacterium]